MEPFYRDNHNTLYNIDFRKNDLPDESVQMVVTSPPYWGLRKYSGDQELIWGGDKDCEHKWVTHHQSPKGRRNLPDNMPNTGGDRTQQLVDNPRFGIDTNFCSLCGAWRGALGLEPTIELYLQHLIEIMREIKRILRSDGVFLLNIGDSYSATRWSNTPSTSFNPPAADIVLQKQTNLPPKNLCLIPFRVAIAAQEDGWWVRSIIIWNKPNPMPESVTDRPTESHEYILMLTQSGTPQYWTHRDHEGIRTQPKPDYRWIHKDTKEEINTPPEGWTPKNKMGWDRVNLWRGHDYYWDADAVREITGRESSWQDYPQGDWKDQQRDIEEGKIRGHLRKHNAPALVHPAGRNLRSVWSFPTTPFPAAHFAVFPEKLPERCIKAATPEVGCCSKCGAPWARVTERPDIPEELYTKTTRPNDGLIHAGIRKDGKFRGSGQKVQNWREQNPISTLGWRPTCKCNAPRVPSVVLDPFAGAGTTLLVAKKLNRRAVGYELSEEYCQLTVKRCKQTMLEI